MNYNSIGDPKSIAVDIQKLTKPKSKDYIKEFDFDEDSSKRIVQSIYNYPITLKNCADIIEIAAQLCNTMTANGFIKFLKGIVSDGCSSQWAVICLNKEKAKQVISNIETYCGKRVKRKIEGINDYRIYFTDNTSVMWIKPSYSNRGYKFNKMWCDKEIERTLINHVVMPCYLGKDEDIIWI